MNTPTAAPFFIAKVEPDGQQCDAWPEQPLLLSLEQGGIDWPSSCRNGTCRTCICRVRSGAATHRIAWPGLSVDEKREGYILPCVAEARSDLVLEAPAARRIA